MSILIAEDNMVNQKVAVAMLKKFGVESQVVANGIEAISLLRKLKFVVTKFLKI